MFQFVAMFDCANNVVTFQATHHPIRKLQKNNKTVTPQTHRKAMIFALKSTIGSHDADRDLQLTLTPSPPLAPSVEQVALYPLLTLDPLNLMIMCLLHPIWTVCQADRNGRRSAP